jgi:lipopolysaccharide biosynthesis regulator YciM
VETFQAVLEADPKHQAALGDLVQVQEELQDFDQALETQKRLDKVAGQERPAIWAQLKTERGKQLLKAGLLDQAQAAFKKALSWDKNCVEALLCLGDLHLALGEVKKALGAWAKVAQAAPKLAFLALERATSREWPAQDLEAVDEFILATASASQDPWAQTLAARHLAGRGKEAETVAALRRLLEIAPGFLPAHRDLGLILLDRGQIDELLSAYKQLLERLPSQEREFECRQCGFRSGELTWKCPSCRQWGTLGPLP